MNERNYWLGFSVFSGIGPVKFKKILSEFGSAKEAWEAPGSHLVRALRERLTEKFDEFRNKFSLNGYAKKLKDSGVSFLILTDKEYPELLKKIKNPPFVLYVKGNIGSLYSSSGAKRSPEVLLDDGSGQDGYQMVTRQARTIIPTIAVVGARKTTQYGREVTKILAEELVLAGFTIVSGLAIGIDAVSHKTAIENNGKTIAVLGCGVDCCYPSSNLSIYNSIIARKGCVVSEMPLGSRPTRGSFPARNRIIAGLSLGVLVTEGAEDSGSLITANYALSFGRRVFAVPGPITSSMSKGPYKLIAKGAKLVTSTDDILKELKFEIRNSKSETISKSKIQKGQTKEEREILKLLQNEPLHFDEIVRKTGLQSSEIGSILSIMEVKGMIKSLDGGLFRLEIDTRQQL